METLNTKITGDGLTANEWNQVASEIQNIFEAYGISPSAIDLNQLGKALSNKATTGNFFTDSGVANAYVLSSLSVNQDPTEYREGMRIRFIANNANTGASTVNVAGLGVKAISTEFFASTPIPEGSVSGFTELEYNGGLFTLLNFAQQNQPNAFTENITYLGKPIEDIAIPNWLDASQVGNSFSKTQTNVQVATLDALTIAVIENTNDKLSTYEWDGTDWSLVGNEFSIPATGRGAICALNSTTVALVIDTVDLLSTYEWDGTDWSLVGNTLDITPKSGNYALSMLTPTTIALAEQLGATLNTYEWDGTDWSKTANSLSIPGMVSPAIGSLSSTTVALINTTDQDLETYEWDGTNWTKVGNALAIAIQTRGLCILTDSDTLLINTNGDSQAYRWDGTDWAEIGYLSDIITGIFSGGCTTLNGSEFVLAYSNNIETFKLSFFVGDGPHALTL